MRTTDSIAARWAFVSLTAQGIGLKGLHCVTGDKESQIRDPTTLRHLQQVTYTKTCPFKETLEKNFALLWKKIFENSYL